MDRRLVIWLLGLVSLGTPLWADACNLRAGLFSALGTQTEMIRDLRSGSPVTGDRIRALRQERAELSALNLTDAALDEAATYILADMAALDAILASGSLPELERHLSGAERRDRLSQLEQAFAGIKCQSIGAAEADVGDLGLSLLPNGRLGTAAMTASTILVFTGLWAVYGIRSRAEALRRRYLVALKTVLSVDQDVLRAQVNNISRTGAQIKMTEGVVPLKDRKVSLTLKGIEIHARVVWQNDAIAGMAFDKPLDEGLFQSLTRAQKPQRPGRIGRRPDGAQS